VWRNHAESGVMVCNEMAIAISTIKAHSKGKNQQNGSVLFRKIQMASAYFKIHGTTALWKIFRQRKKSGVDTIKICRLHRMHFYCNNYGRQRIGFQRFFEIF
jgi:hypothetical protein